MGSDGFASRIARQRRLVTQGRTRPLAWRLEQLGRLEKALQPEEELLEALAADLRKPPVEAHYEISSVRQELKLFRRQLRRWLQPERVTAPLIMQPSRAWVVAEPLGCVLIIGPWNYPLMLLLSPLVAALGAGNTAVLKPSEHAPRTGELLAARLRQHMDGDVASVVMGGPETAQALLAHRFDHVFFTGGNHVGRLVMEQAAKTLTPVTLELGGKNPCLVTEDANIPLAARRIAWGRFLNAGQTCLAPDYVLVDPGVRDAFLTALQQAVLDFYGDDPQASPDFGRIVNDSQFRRLAALLRERSVLWGGHTDPTERYVAPTVVAVEQWDDPLMEEEIFGPVLPILPLPSLEEALDAINSRPHPLALYLFSGRRAWRDRLLAGTSSGTVCLNDVVLQGGIPQLPFGGVGESGMGAYHGRAGFARFSHQRSVLQRPQGFDAPWRYPPYGNRLRWMRRLLG
ncbi:MAG: aldehyde dehydrogenase family protein [Synechococcus sp. SB0668_bin_15]|nr:aldehyde dehydrogenase family protein [Synechococcus sp. SB0668_bin_15]MXZ82895.1 aldehyde dehydrogenase family protein [Synechococcus sp. SB0666_bin_14]MYC49804.1 aldehyde dehydrogenase family protein [Synechococcus sp. SB0662_bin_14]MYG45876.1 aldehyde dehydrogenase family protein [Synechococcus sp. SB0675_bin_6]